jgi:cholesterol oxidase
MTFDYDVLVIGSGFGGSVSALRLTEKGYDVGVLEMGRRWRDEDFPKTSWNLRKWLWAPALGCYGPMRMTLLKNSFFTSAVGVGGGSLVYAQTLYEPLPGFYTDRQWAHITDWRTELAPYFDQASRMLGVTPNPRETHADRLLKEVAVDMGLGADACHPTNVGVFFGEEGKTLPDPFFGGAGPERTGCVFCARCMTGCPNNAKNTLPKNYLHLAENAGAKVLAERTVVDVRPRASGGYDVHTVRTGRTFRKQRQVLTADQVVFAAAAIGTQRLLHKLRDGGSLPDVSPRLGELTRTNSESMGAAVTSIKKADDLADGIVLTSSMHVDDRTHVEIVHYGKGSNALGGLLTPLVEGHDRRSWRWFVGLLRHPGVFLRGLNLHRASERSIVVVTMQDADNSLTTYTKRGLFGRRTMTSKQGPGDPNPVWIPEGSDVTKRLAEKLDGDAYGTLPDVFNVPMTAHFIGGCPIGDGPESGVVDPYQRMFGHPGLHVMDGSAISANLGVNPSLTITAQAERAMSFWPNKGDADPRPALGSSYQLIAAVKPLHPTVPESAPGALRLPIVKVNHG